MLLYLQHSYLSLTGKLFLQEAKEKRGSELVQHYYGAVAIWCVCVLRTVVRLASQYVYSFVNKPFLGSYYQQQHAD